MRCSAVQWGVSSGKKLWQQGAGVDERIERFTVGSDWQHDNRLVVADCLASLAHAEGLAGIGILDKTELRALRGELLAISAGQSRDPLVTREHEDCHSAIEFRLTDRLGGLGKKIHSGRSRNDQVFAALLVFGRQRLLDIAAQVHGLTGVLVKRAGEEEHTPMMGRTHLQGAMPSTAGLWFAAYADLLLSLEPSMGALYTMTNRSPLGSAAGYGVPLPLDRERVAHLLGFAEPIHTVLGAANLRGHWEGVFVDVLANISLVLSRFAQDLMLFTLPELGYFALPRELATGSSIMPHKQNPDVLELLRAKTAVIVGASAQIKQVTAGLPSGYNRDLQEIKPLLFGAIDACAGSLEAAGLVAGRLLVNRERLTAGIDERIYSVDRIVILMTEKNMSFRDAYHQVKKDDADGDAGAGAGADGGGDFDYQELLARRESVGAPGNLQVPVLGARQKACADQWAGRQAAVNEALTALTGDDGSGGLSGAV